MSDSHPLIQQLAAEHAEHLRWLRARMRGRLPADDAEDVLQAAYANALRSLRGSNASRPPQFATPDKATAWFRTIAGNLAIDDERRQRGRSGQRRDPERPRPAPGTELPLVDAGVDVEGDVLNAIERESHQPIIVRAIAALAPEHRQILQLRYGRDLEPAAIMLLENITRRQWDGRHDRALKAFARALARVQVNSECRRTRRLLRRSPAALLRPAAAAPTRAHVETCLACGAFARSTHVRLARSPLTHASTRAP